MEINQLPISYSESDQIIRQGIIKQIGVLNEIHLNKIEPLLQHLAAIDSCYVPRYFVSGMSEQETAELKKRLKI